MSTISYLLFTFSCAFALCGAFEGGSSFFERIYSSLNGLDSKAGFVRRDKGYNHFVQYCTDFDITGWKLFNEQLF